MGHSGEELPLLGTRLDVWQVIETVQNSGNSVEEAAEYLGLPVQRVQAAINYYAAHREEVDDIAERERATANRAETSQLHHPAIPQ